MSFAPGNGQKCLRRIQNTVKLYTSQSKSLPIFTHLGVKTPKIWEDEKLKKFQICHEQLLADRHLFLGG